MKKSKYEYLSYVVFHPIEGFEEFIYNKAGSLPLSLAILVIWFFSKIIERQATGFVHNYNILEELNMINIFIQTIILFVLWCASNWAFCTLMDGKGTFRNIWISCSYALLPMVFCTLAATLVSSYLSYDEEVFRVMIIGIGSVWSTWLMICAVRTVHDYSFGKTLLSILLTLFGIGFIFFLLVLSISLYKQVFDLFRAIYSEIKFRL